MAKKKYKEMGKSTCWLNGCHGYHAKAISLIATILETMKDRPNTLPSLRLLEQRVHELVRGIH